MRIGSVGMQWQVTCTDRPQQSYCVHMQAERQRLASIPGMLNPNDIKQEDMVDA